MEAVQIPSAVPNLAVASGAAKPVLATSADKSARLGAKNDRNVEFVQIFSNHAEQDQGQAEISANGQTPAASSQVQRADSNNSKTQQDANDSRNQRAEHQTLQTDVLNMAVALAAIVTTPPEIAPAPNGNDKPETQGATNSSAPGKIEGTAVETKSVSCEEPNSTFNATVDAVPSLAVTNEADAAPLLNASIERATPRQSRAQTNTPLSIPNDAQQSDRPQAASIAPDASLPKPEANVSNRTMGVLMEEARKLQIQAGSVKLSVKSQVGEDGNRIGEAKNAEPSTSPAKTGRGTPPAEKLTVINLGRSQSWPGAKVPQSSTVVGATKAPPNLPNVEQKRDTEKQDASQQGSKGDAGQPAEVADESEFPILVAGNEKSAIADEAVVKDLAEPPQHNAQAAETPAQNVASANGATHSITNQEQSPATSQGPQQAANATAPNWHAPDDSSGKGVSTAQLTDAANHSEMRITMQTDKLGSIELRAHVSGETVGAAITVEKRDAHSVLAVELPALQQALSEKSLRVDQVALFQGSLNLQDGQTGREMSQQQFSQGQQKGGIWSMANGRVSPLITAEYSQSGVFDSQGRLNVRA